MGQELAVALTDEPGISYIVLTDLTELLVPDVASARWSRIQTYRGNKKPHLCIALLGAVYGPTWMGGAVSEKTVPMPQSS